jgi:hypothetical protein
LTEILFYYFSDPSNSSSGQVIKRGPGRPRKPNGPGNQGFRGLPRSRGKHVGQLVTSLGNSTSTPIDCSPSSSSGMVTNTSFKDEDDESKYEELE